MNIKTISSDRLGESCIEAEHSSGLKIYICPKKEFTSSYALFGTRYGSVDTKFRIKGETEYTCVPEGIAHFLEHKLFENEDCDAFERFAKTGAYSNAYTSFDRTCYLFSCTSNFESNLDILLDFVRSPYFTEQSVQKEQGIIGQEIRMYDDDPQWCVLFNLFGALYHNHPVKIDIAGTVESIAQITDKLLYKCYNTFYNPSNMFVCVAGPVDPDKVLRQIDTALAGAVGTTVERGMFDEPDSIVRPLCEQKMSVSKPMFSIGFKESSSGRVSVRDQIETDIMLEIISGKSSELFNQLLSSGLINDGFEGSYFNGYGYAAEIFDGESKDPGAVKSALISQIEKFRRSGISDDEFERAKNAVYGKDVMMYNSVERVASALVECAMSGHGLFEVNDILFSVKKDDIERRLRRQLNEEKCAMSVILPAD